MNRYERFVAKMGFSNPRVGKTRHSPDELIGIHFDDYDPAITRRVLGKCKNHKPNLFFYRLSKTRAIRVDTKNNVVLLVNSARAVEALAKTVNN
jgi:hypothetical protein